MEDISVIPLYLSHVFAFCHLERVSSFLFDVLVGLSNEKRYLLKEFGIWYSFADKYDICCFI